MSYKLLKVPPLEGFHPPPEVDKSADPDSLYLPATGGQVGGGGGLQSSSNTVSVIGTQANIFLYPFFIKKACSIVRKKSYYFAILTAGKN